MVGVTFEYETLKFGLFVKAVGAAKLVHTSTVLS